MDFKNLVSKYLDEVSTAKLNNHDIRLILNELLFFYRYEYILWGIYLLLIFFQIIRHKKAFLFCRSKNTYRNNNKIAHKEIWTKNLKDIFEKVKKILEDKKYK